MRSRRRLACLVTGGVLATVAAGVWHVSTATGSAGAASFAVAARSSGVVVINTNLSYATASAAGTGTVISSSGEVLTNNHVIRGATSITVTVPATGKTYKAQVLGYAIGADVAALKLANASGLATVSLGSSASVARGAAVTAVGNAGGTGSLASSVGAVTALGRTITVSDDSGDTTRLTGLIQTNAALEPGDSGGALLDAAGRVIGMNTAASSGLGSEGYAVPINKALAIARKIGAGRGSAAIHVGPTAFLGILGTPARSNDAGGALVQQVVSDSPAAKAGISPGDVISRIGNRAVTTTKTIVSALQAKRPGDSIAITWTDQYGGRTTATVKLASGPPQ